MTTATLRQNDQRWGNANGKHRRPFDKKSIRDNPAIDAVEGLLQEVFLNNISVENQAATPPGKERGRA